MRSADEEMANANLEMQRMAHEALNRCYQRGAKEDDLKFIGWLAGLTDWKPTTSSTQEPE